MEHRLLFTGKLCKSAEMADNPVFIRGSKVKNKIVQFNSRLAFAGIFEDFPNLKIVAHHVGAMELKKEGLSIQQ